MFRLAIPLFSLLLLLPVACDEPGSNGPNTGWDVGAELPPDTAGGDTTVADTAAPHDPGPGSPDSQPPTDPGATDPGPPSDPGGGGDTGPDTGPSLCEPTPGGADLEVHCSEIRIAVMKDSSLPTRVHVAGRLWGFGEGEPCVRVDQLQLLQGDTIVQTVDAAGVVGPDGWSAEAEATTEVVGHCDSESGRFEPFAILVTGRVDGGTFTADCGAHMGGGSWPPDGILTCHENIPVPPSHGDSMVDVAPGMWTMTTLDIMYPFDPAFDMTAVDSSVRIIPSTYASGMPIEPFDTMGWDAWIGSPSSANDWLMVSLSHNEDVLGTEVCPPYSDDPFADPPPLFLARITGTNAGRSFSSEGYIDFCSRVVMQ